MERIYYYTDFELHVIGVVWLDLVYSYLPTRLLFTYLVMGWLLVHVLANDIILGMLFLLKT